MKFLVVLFSFFILSMGFAQETPYTVPNYIPPQSATGSCNEANLNNEVCPAFCVLKVISSTGGHYCLNEQNYQAYESCARMNSPWSPGRPPCNSPGTAGSFGQYTPQVESCRAETVKATDGCVPEKNSGMATAMELGSSLKTMLDQGAQSSITGACSQMGKLSQAVDAGTSAYKAVCFTGYSSCSSTCDDAKTAVEQGMVAGDPTGYGAQALLEIRTQMRSCNQLQGNLNTAATGIKNLAGMQQMQAMCKSALSTNTLAEICKNDPNNPLCKDPSIVNCGDPATASTNLVCICSANPTNPKCGGGFGDGAGNYASSDGGVDGSAGLDDFGGGAGGFDPSSLPVEPYMGDPAQGRNTSLGGQGGRGVSVSGGGGAGGGPNGRGGAAGGLNTKINNGYYGGGSGAGGFGAGGGGGSGQPGVAGSAYNPRTGQSPQVDLKRFMPGGQNDPRRALAGVSGPDGITGPHTDIWQKIRKRYFAVTPSLLP